MEEVTKRLSEMKVLLYGDGEQEAKPEKCAQMAELLIASGLVPKLITELDKLPFEARKQFAQVYNNLMRRDLAGFVSHTEGKPEILSALVAGYENPEVALNCGTMLREVNYAANYKFVKVKSCCEAQVLTDLYIAVNSPRDSGRQDTVLSRFVEVLRCVCAPAQL